ncbi:MAG: hypothetical protein HYZ27_07195 [Deltaproteobacteria bacterium]|nr:hypothetical protein [Deltaproteobacteria bacterium]
MFSVDAHFAPQSMQREQVLALTQSMNAITVQVPGFPVAPAMGYVLSYAPTGGQAAVVILLHYSDSNRTVAYVPDEASFPLTDLPRVTEEAAVFLESMGFILDDTAFGTLAPAEQEALLQRTPLPAAGTTAAPAAAASPKKTAAGSKSEAVGRLLMSF